MYRFELGDIQISDLSIALEMAKSAHEGQVDKAGESYFKHPQTVCEIASNMILSWEEEFDDFLVKAKIVSYLHDVIEDTSLTIDDLWEHNIPTDCILAIETLTKKKEQDYWDYLAQVRLDKLATVVKIADLTHNSDLSRLDQVKPEDIARHEKYLRAIEYLSSFKCEKCGDNYSIADMGEKVTRRNEIVCKSCLEQYEIEYDEYEEWLEGEKD